MFCVHVSLLYVWFVCVLFVPSVLWCCWLGLLTCKNSLPYNLYCVVGDVKQCSIQSNVSASVLCCTPAASVSIDTSVVICKRVSLYSLMLFVYFCDIFCCYIACFSVCWKYCRQNRLFDNVRNPTNPRRSNQSIVDSWQSGVSVPAGTSRQLD